MPQEPLHSTATHQLASSGDDALATNSSEPKFGPPAVAGEVGRLAGYRIQKQLGKGGMGAVYLAFDEGLRRQIALKVMLPKFAADPLAKERFLREARAAAAVRNDHVVTIYQVGEDAGIPFIAMDYLSGYPLDAFLKRKGRLTIPQAVRVGLETATGLAAAHALGLVHRDIKPANLWLESPQGRIKILDFGLARQTDGSSLAAGVTATGVVVGTPAFMSPEQARGDAVDHRSDLFSLGAVLYHLTTGRLPFSGPTPMAMMIALATEEPPPVQSLNPEVPPEFAALIHRLMAKKLADRPASATEVANILRAMEFALTNPNAMASTSQPQVVYVPIPVSELEEQHDLGAFANLETAITTEPEAESEGVEPAVVQSRDGFPKWVIVAALLLAAGAVAGVAALMKRPVEAAKQEPENPPQQNPPSKTDPAPKPTLPVLDAPDANRRLAKWVIDNGGVVIGDPGGIFKDGSKLPNGAFSVSFVELGKTFRRRVTDDDLDLFKNTSVKSIFLLPPSDISDKGLENLSQSGLEKQLTSLALLDAPQITDAGMPFIGRFRGLTILGLHNAKITDAGLGHLNNLPNLVLLELNGTGITNANLVSELGGLPKLTNLHVKNTKVTLAGVKKLLIAKPDLKVTMDYDQTADPDYKLAAWVFSKSPDAYVTGGPKREVLRKVNQLPKEPFLLLGVHLGNAVCTDDDIDRFRDTTAIYLGLGRTSITDKGWLKWSKFPNVGRIDTLRVSGPEVTDNATYHFIAFQALRTLEIRDAEITDKTLGYLEALPSLKTLIIHNTKVTSEGVKKLKAKRPDINIAHSDAAFQPDRNLAEWVIANKGMVWVRYGDNRSFGTTVSGKLPKEPFHVFGIGDGTGDFTIADADLDLILRCSGLESIQPRQTTLSDDGLEKLATAEFAAKLKILEVNSPTITDDGVANLKAFPSLGQLGLRGSPITDAGLQHLATLKNLKTLDLKGTKVTTPGVKRLMMALPENCKVDFDYNQFTDPDRTVAKWVIQDGGTVFLGTKQLREIRDIPDGSIVVTSVTPALFTDRHVKELRDLPRLTTVALPGDPKKHGLTDKGLAEWATLPNVGVLKTLFCTNSNLTDAGMEHLAKFTALELADFSGSAITDEGLKKLTGMKSLKVLSMLKTKITPEGAKAFRAALPSCTLITDFDKN